MQKPLYIVWGKVEAGKKRGRALGFPTANIKLHKNIPEGIYAAKVKVDKIDFLAATFVGKAKTFQETKSKIEPFLLEFNGNLYGKWITITLFKKIRDNMKFASEKELSRQMGKDVEDVKHFFTS
ncbi:MAG TPA: riboflavin kinase [Patescibacteria group bacterium]